MNWNADAVIRNRLRLRAQPSPSAPTSSAMRAPDDERANSARLNAGSRGVSATIVNP
jgi:hypothetical protein